MIRVTNQKDWIKGFNISNQSGLNLQISHLLYADDTLIFCDAKTEQVSNIRVVLVIFEAISGLAVNWGEKQHLPSQGSGKYSDVGNAFGE